MSGEDAAAVEALTRVLHVDCLFAHKPDHTAPPCERAARVVLAAGYRKSDPVRDAEVDRNARAYGWSVGRGHPLTEVIEDVDPENPFLNSDWRAAIAREATR